jgi:hypothetical protein
MLVFGSFRLVKNFLFFLLMVCSLLFVVALASVKGMVGSVRVRWIGAGIGGSGCNWLVPFVCDMSMHWDYKKIVLIVKFMQTFDLFLHLPMIFEVG